MKQQLHFDLPVPSQTRLLHRYHSDIREFTPEHTDTFSRNDILLKQHIPPTQGNVSLLAHVKKVVLLREPEEIVLAYRRAEMRGIHEQRKEFSGATTEEKWLIRAKENHLLDDLRFFYDNWRSQEGENTLIIYYRDLISAPTAVVNRIEDFFGLPRSEKTVSLSKARYTHHCAIVYFLRDCGHRIISLLRFLHLYNVTRRVFLFFKNLIEFPARKRKNR